MWSCLARLWSIRLLGGSTYSDKPGHRATGAYHTPTIQIFWVAPNTTIYMFTQLYISLNYILQLLISPLVYIALMSPTTWFLWYMTCPYIQVNTEFFIFITPYNFWSTEVPIIFLSRPKRSTTINCPKLSVSFPQCPLFSLFEPVVFDYRQHVVSHCAGSYTFKTPFQAL